MYSSDDDGLLFEDDEWEDNDFVAHIQAKYPGWILVKLSGFTSKTFVDVETWLASGNVRFGKYEPVGWMSGCAYSVGAVFESKKDASIFKLRWS